LRKDKKFIVYASSQAQRATDFILNIRNKEKDLDLADQSLKSDKGIDREKELRGTREMKKEHSIEIEK
jgi:hypothetical protein